MKSVWFTVINDIIPTNERLAKIHLIDTTICKYCGKPDTLQHRITECKRRDRHMEVDTHPTCCNPPDKANIHFNRMDYPPTIPLLNPPAAGGNFTGARTFGVFPNNNNDVRLPSTTPTTCDALDGRHTVDLNTEKNWDAVRIYYSNNPPTGTRTTNNRDITRNGFSPNQTLHPK
jgi:hypothetical protein